jgi:hypothetical protein
VTGASFAHALASAEAATNTELPIHRTKVFFINILLVGGTRRV